MEHVDIGNLVEGVLTFNIQKQAKYHKIILGDKAHKLIEQYKFFKLTTPQRENIKIKQLSERAGINEITEVSKRSGKELIKWREPKHDIITTHTARRTFVTLAFQRGKRIENISQYIGHSSIEVTQTYIAKRLSDLEGIGL
jgi:integrase